MVPHFPIDKTLRTWKLQSLSLTDEICYHLKQSIKKLTRMANVQNGVIILLVVVTV